MRRHFSLFVICSVVCGLWTIDSFAQDWKEEKGDHFIVYYINETAKPKDILLKAEHSYTKIADDLGYSRYSEFWQWDHRVKIYVHPSKESFQKATGQPAWSDGMASYNDKSIHTIEGTDNFLTNVLPHEITHLIFRDFVGLRAQAPLWLDEGVAQWEEEDKRDLALKIMPSLARRVEVFTVKRLTATDIRRESDSNKVDVFYLEAISLVDFLVRNYGTSRFTDFCRNLRDGKPFEEALRKAFTPYVNNLEDLQDKWMDHVLAQGKIAS